MTNKELKELDPYSRLLFWIKERHAMYRRKELGIPKPWSSNPLMRDTYFTNVYRELDKTTKWFANNIREPLRYKPEVLFATICFRWFNRIETGVALSLYRPRKVPQYSTGIFEDWNIVEAKKILNSIKEEGEQVFTGAFNISNSGSRKPKIDRVCDDYIQPVWEQRDRLAEAFTRFGQFTLANAHKTLGKLPGLGGSGFMAGQVVADLRHTYLLQDAPDLKYWSSIGPGSRRGMNYLHSRPPESPISSKQWQSEMKELVDKVNNELKGGSYKWPYIHAQDLQNCLCESSKMNNILFGNGRSKRRYAGC
jgi:alpha-glutamyl/putrescinyl thymine pyrophosphorylase clade 1